MAYITLDEIKSGGQVYDITTRYNRNFNRSRRISRL